MAKRFGRNQRRQLREQIASLEERTASLEHALFGEWERATGRYPALSDFGLVMEHEVRSSTTDRRIEKRAELRIYIGNADLRKWGDLIQNRPTVEWGGFAWILDSIGRNSLHHDFLESQYLDVELVAFASRKRSKKTTTPRPLWPERYDAAALALLKAEEMDVRTFRSLYECNPWSDSH